MKTLKETLQTNESATAGTAKGKKIVQKWFDILGPEKFMEKLMQYYDESRQGVSLEFARYLEADTDNKAEALRRQMNK